MKKKQNPYGQKVGFRSLHMVALASIAMLAACTRPGFQQHRDLIKVDPPGAPVSGVKVTYLGVNGYLLQSRDSTVLVDPYFSRVPFLPYALKRPIAPNEQQIDWGLKQILRPGQKVDLILVTHGHVDHLFDVSSVARRTGARVVASRTACNLLRSLHELPTAKLSPMLELHEPSDLQAQETKRFGAVTVQGLMTDHDYLPVIGVPDKGLRKEVPQDKPRTSGDWVLGEPLAFVVTMGGRRIYITSGGHSAPMQSIRPVDLAIVGTAVKDARLRLKDTLLKVHPKVILPSHQDDIFMAPDKGFHFGTTANMDDVMAQLSPEPDLKRRVILLDYFRPWTL
jgi:L-ascorbate metabolism protein UlaG (beta-lactamase superfamily)